MSNRRIAKFAALVLALGASIAVGQDDANRAKFKGSLRTDQYNGVDIVVDLPRAQDRTISVSGVGKVSASPDVADISLGVVAQAESARDALKANNEAMDALRKVLKERGVADKDVQTTNVGVEPQYSQPPQVLPGQPQPPHTPKIVGYQVTNTVQITARDLDKLGGLLDAVVQAGANQMQGIAFRFDDPEKLLEVARKRAMADAKRKAGLLAGEAGVVVGPPIRISESEWPYPPPSPDFGGRMMEMAAPAAPSVPVAPGEQELRVSVQVVYELRPAK